MEDSGVEVVSQWYRWVYMRKKASDGPFEMYTDTDSKIAQYRRIKNFFRVALIVEFICFWVELDCLMQTRDIFCWIFTLLAGLFFLVCLRIIWKCRWKIEQLKRE